MTADMAVIGLGAMGGRAAVRAAEQGLDVVGFDPVDVARDRAAAGGVRIVDAAEAVTGVPIVVLSVPLPGHVAGLASGELRQADEGTVVVDLSTIDPQTARAAHADLADVGVTYLDAPVLGRPERCGFWTLVVGGPAETVESVTPTLERTVAARIVRIGDVGSGSVVKLLNNLMFGAINAVTAEALTICRRSGVDAAMFVDAVAESGAATVSNLFRELAPRLVAGDDEEPTFALELLTKDNGLALQLAREVQVAAPIGAAVNLLNIAGLAQGYGGFDSGAVQRVYQSLAPGGTP